MVTVPIVEREELQLLNIDHEGILTLMDDRVVTGVLDRQSEHGGRYQERLEGWRDGS
jgi:hypothetical protein